MRYYLHARRADSGIGMMMSAVATVVAHATVQSFKNVLRLVSAVNIVTA